MGLLRPQDGTRAGSAAIASWRVRPCALAPSGTHLLLVLIARLDVRLLPLPNYVHAKAIKRRAR